MSTQQIPTYVVLGSGGHRINVGKDAMPYPQALRAEDGKNPNLPIPNWLVPVGEDMPADFPTHMLDVIWPVPLTAANGKLYMGYYEFPLEAIQGGRYRLSMTKQDIERWVHNANLLFGGKHHGAVISEFGVRDQSAKPILTRQGMYVTEFLDQGGQHPLEVTFTDGPNLGDN